MAIPVVPSYSIVPQDPHLRWPISANVSTACLAVAIGLACVGLLPRFTYGVPIRAGAAAVNINPVTFPVIQNGGFLEASSDRVADPLFARCIVIESGETQLAMIVVDSCMMPREFCDAVKQTIQQRTGIPVSQIMISATHTHSAPSVMDYCLGSRADEAYREYLPDRLVAAVELAQQRLQPARIGATRVDAGAMTNCRRWITRPDRVQMDPFGIASVRANMHPGYLSDDFTGPSGPTDPWLTLWSVQTAQGKPLALLANFSMHYFSGHNGLSADYFGRYVYQMQQRLAPHDESFVAIMSQGTSGDLWWGDYSQAKSDGRSIDNFAHDLVELSVQALSTVSYETEPKVAINEHRMTLGRRLPDHERELWAREMLRRMGDRRPQDRSEVYAEQAIYLLEHPTCEVVLQTIQLGELAIATLPNEVYGLTGLKIKLQSPLELTMCIELANGASGYIPPPEQHPLGGYNTWPARTAGLEVLAEPKMVEQLLRMLEDITETPRRESKELIGDYSRQILDDNPLAYYRAADLAGPTLMDASENHAHAGVVGNVAFFLPGPESLAMKGNMMNRAVHLAGASIATPVIVDQKWTVHFWCWNGLVPTTRAVTGTLLNADDATVYVTGSGGGSPGRLAVGQHVGKREIGRYAWHHVAVTRDGSELNVYLDGSLELTAECHSAGPRALRFGAGTTPDESWEGRLDEISISSNVWTRDRIRQLVERTQASPPSDLAP